MILLDIMLPGMDGFAFCQTVRQHSQIPIIMMSARSTKTDQLLGFELGADDYIEKTRRSGYSLCEASRLVSTHFKSTDQA